ncbi:acyl-CoA mutase large subunit family protein [Peribacillus frigoritolerans]|uniref:acyl-CoA mutase large subunit family protein n=1 Tax=Peribacillus frigoritolerans TaxID=450367 RepID=UPI0021D05B2C|nr:acyl-CoA mutase large subunit family protein [Peribacillus frigoritolerans]MCU6598992.1 acyl-CoA mutase large subunit family protein [Peribacillus frigoritolerans]
MTEKLKNPETDAAEKTLFSDFPTPTFQQWREIAEKSLKGATIEEKLVTNTYEGIQLQPLYRMEDIEDFSHLSSIPGEFPFVRGTKELGYGEEPWEVCQELIYSSPEEFNQAARSDLEKGQTMLHVVLDESRFLELDFPRAQQKNSKRRGVPFSSLQDFQKAFNGINLEKTPIYIEAGMTGFPFFASFMAYLRKQKQNPKNLRGCFGMDPFGQLVQSGILPYSINQSFEMMSEITRWSKEYAPDLQTIVVGANPYHDAGGNAVQELAFAIATGVEYLRNIETEYVSLDDIAQRMRFSFSIGANFFMEIAKFRAARMLWSRIVKELGGNEDSQKMSIHARTSAWTKTVNDPYVNILRGTVEAFGGIIGGINSLHVSPFDEAIRPAEEFSRRIARNTHSILDEEANLSKVADPAGGSWYIESLTYSLAEKAWELFQQIEEKGGMYHSLLEGFPQDLVSKTAELRKSNINNKKDKFVGTNIYPNLNEIPIKNGQQKEEDHIQNQNSPVNDTGMDGLNSNVNLLFVKEALQDFVAAPSMENAINASSSGATLDNINKAMRLAKTMTPSINTVRIHRGAEPFEELREHAEVYKEKTGGLPKVFVANIGSVSQYKKRADFVTDFFEVGGFTSNEYGNFSTVTEAVEAFRFSQSRIFVICSSDENYQEWVPSLARGIKQFSPETSVLLAGNPNIQERAMYMEAGVDDFIHASVNNYDKLVVLQIKGGVRE